MRKIKPYTSRLWAMLLILVAIVVLMAMLRQCSHRQASPFRLEYTKSGGDTLDVAIEMAPGIYSLAGDTVIGRDYSLLLKMSSEIGRPVKFHPFVPLGHALAGLRDGDYDIVAASLPATADLRDSFLLSDPVYLDREVLVQRLDSASVPAITSQLQLAKDTIWLAADSPFAQRIKNLSQEIGDTIYVLQSPQYSAEHLVILVAKGKIRLAVVNESIAARMAKDYPQIDASTPISFTQFQAWALRKGNDSLASIINAWLKSSSAADSRETTPSQPASAGQKSPL
ncbi:MAG: transporter substrate-binding domain-containing protein [Clostridium sp.]|nr:transporter substrate-binding domain-containing protein [Clostridium sp.]